MQSQFKQRVLGAVLACALPPATAQSADQQEPTTLPAVTVSAAADTGASLNPSVEQERRRLARIPGGTGIALPQEEGKLATLRDVLGHQPGVTVQDWFGSFDAPRLSIRGSGIQSHPASRGVAMLMDGLPLNEADGSYVSSVLEPRNAAQISIRRGANARSPGNEALGGEMDFQSLTGREERGRVRLEAGSFGQQAWQAAVGTVGERFDGRISVSGDRYDGFRHHTNGERDSLQANLGYRGESGFENRSYFAWTDLAYRIAGALPMSRAYGDPSQIMGDGNTAQDRLSNLYRRNPHRNVRQTRLANRSLWGNDALRHELGLWWQNADVEEQNPVRASLWGSDTTGAQWQTTGAPNETLRWRVAAAWSGSDIDRDFYAISPQIGALLQRFGSFDLSARNAHLSAGLDIELAPGWTLVGDIKWNRVERDVKSRSTTAALDREWSYATPKLGVVWKPAANLRTYANLSRSHEAPTFDDLVVTSVSMSNPAQASASLVPLGVQRATTVEVGAEGSLGSGAEATRWQLSIYRSMVDDELIRTTDAAGVSVGTYNYVGGTRHQGVEAGIDGGFRLAGNAFEYRASWTWSDYRFRDGEFAGNRIAGISRHFVNAELLYLADGWRVGPTLRWQPLDEPTDHANSSGYAQKRYALLGLRAEYRNGPWIVHVHGDNLTDKRYASSISVTDRSTPTQMLLFPGSGRSISAGLSYTF
ncbi:MAG: TonB-dependent receptor [Rhodocyclaceae bacterium]|nr:TonB-dependent receptor [Rhodocyclaceae bacterium]